MTRDEALRRLKAAKPILDRYRVRRAGLFGSTARDMAGPESDVDVIVEFDEPPGLIGFAGLARELGDVFGRQVDLVTPGGLHPALRSRILSEVVHG